MEFWKLSEKNNTHVWVSCAGFQVSRYTHSVVGTQRIEGVGPADKQSALPAEQDLHIVTALVLKKEKTTYWKK